MLTPLTISLRDGAHASVSRADEGDAEALLAYLDKVAGETDFLSFARGELGISVEQERAYLRSMANPAQGMALKATIAGELVAYVTLARSSRPRLSHAADLGLSVRREHWGLGLGRALCEAVIVEARGMGLTRIELRVRHDNARAIALYEALGFQLEGRLRGAVVASGGAHDDLLFGLLLHHSVQPRLYDHS